MNERPAYEVLMAEKLNQLPLPDLADAIWARIETALDTDMPTDDGGNTPAPPAPSGGSNLLGHLGVFLAVVALITFFIINKNNKEATLQAPVALPQTEAITPDPLPPDRPATGSNNNKVPQAFPQGPGTAPPLVVRADSALPPPVAFTGTDSTATTALPLATPPPVVTQPAAGDTVPRRRPRGVTGITDANYRIVPDRKDSIP